MTTTTLKQTTVRQNFVNFLNKHQNKLTFISGALIVLGFGLGLIGYQELRNLALILATFVAGVPIAVKAIQALSMKAFSIELLVTVAVIGALYIQEYTESSVVTFLFLFGAYLEARTLEKTRTSLRTLIDMAPQVANVIDENGDIQTVGVDDVEVKDRIVIRSGDKVPVDGHVVLGTALINEATITGESVPKTKEINDKVFGGTILDNGYIEILADRVGDDTTFAKIIELVEEAQESKSKAERFLDKFASVYTPAVIILSILVYMITRDLHLSITFLVVACPGALVIGAPVSNVAGIGNGAKHGVLVKGGDVMDRLSKVDTIIFDKTGTLTKGKPQVTDVKTFDFDETELRMLVASLETVSEHHLGQTIVKDARENEIKLVDPKDIEVIKGHGLTGVVNGKKLVVGNLKLMDSHSIDTPSEIIDYAQARQKAGNTAILAAIDGQVKGIFSIADQIRDDAKEALQTLRKHGIKEMIMLTGDNRHTAELVANELGLDEFYAELLPEEKVDYVKKYREAGKVVAMAGDGINDAPAIATAHIGLAMGAGGTDVSMETADVVLMADKLSQFSHAYALSKATMSNMKLNIFIAVAVVIFLLIGVLTGFIHLASGMFVHEASILIVIFNAMRLIKFRLK